jgi:glucose/arabinose dehydrogenase
VSALDPEVADPASERVLIAIPHPLNGHNAGKIAFGPLDGYLYMTSGDGGRLHDPQGNVSKPTLSTGQDSQDRRRWG